MKKFTVIMMLVAMCLASIPAKAQFKWGLEGGVNLSKASLSGNMFDSSNRTGWFIGPKVQFTIPVIGLGIDGAVLYSQKYLKISGNGDLAEYSETKNMPYIDIPINLKYNIGFSSLIGMYISTGPQYSWYMGGCNLTSGLEKVGSLKTSNFSWNVGLGINALNHLQVGLTYNIALGETGQIDGVADAFETIDIKNNTWQVRLAYLF